MFKRLITNIKQFKYLYYLNHKDNTKELVSVLIYKQILPQSKNDCYYFKYPYVKDNLGNECFSKYLTKLSIIELIKYANRI